MKLCSFMIDGSKGYGVIRDDKVERLDEVPNAPIDLSGFIAHRFPDFSFQAEDRSTPKIPLSQVELLPPITEPRNVFCVATNFRDESTSSKDQPAYPLLFLRNAEAQTGHGTAILKPAHSEQFDFEGELAVIVGRRAHKIRRQEAFDYVAGYSCFNDGSVRDWQKHSTQFTPGKNFFRSAGFGPWIVTADEIPDPRQLQLETRVNGIQKQSVGIDRMIFDIPYLLSYISTFSPLNPGDVIVTGTPFGFGSSRNPKEFLAPGDDVEVEISRVGVLRNRVEQDTDPRKDFHNI